MLKRSLKYYLLLWIFAFALSGCGLFENEQKCVFPDYGVEAGYEWVSPRYDSSLTEPEIFPLWRDRDHLNIRFYNWVGRERAEEILKDHRLINRFPQNFYDPLEAGNFVRVTQHPAEYYYTTYGDTTQSSLGNIKEVEYALPVFYFDPKSDPRPRDPNPMVPKIRIKFNENVSLKIQQQWVDSIKATDRLQEYMLLDGSFLTPPEYFFKLTKKSTDNPYSLATNYLTSDLIWSANATYALILGLPQFECNNQNQ